MPGFTGSVNPNAEFHRQHRWQILDFGFPSGPSGEANNLAVYAHSLQLPSLEFDIDSIKSPSVEYKVAKLAKWKNCVIKFYDVQGLYKELQKWQELVWNKEKGLRPANEYKGQPIFALTDGTGAIKQKYTLMGAFPSVIDHGDLSYTNSEIKILTVTFVYDFAEIEFEGDAEQAAVDAATGAADAAVAAATAASAALGGLF